MKQRESCGLRWTVVRRWALALILALGSTWASSAPLTEEEASMAGLEGGAPLLGIETGMGTETEGGRRGVDAVPGCFNLSSPASGSTVSATPTLTWQASANAASYGIRIYTGSCGNYNSPVYGVDNIGGTSHTVPAGKLQAGTKYYWLVSASDSSGKYIMSNICAQGYGAACWTFTTTPAPPCTVTCSASGPSTGTAGSAVGFQSSATASNCSGSVSYSWSFGDGGASSSQNPSHTYANAGTYSWSLTTSTGGATCQKSGTISISAAAGGSCSPDGSTLCLLNGRFGVTADYGDYSGNHGIGHAQALTSDTGYFWFFSSSNVEAVVKLVSFCSGSSGNVGVYAGGLTDLGVTLHVTDTRTNETRDYSNALGTGFRLVRDGPFGCPAAVTPGDGDLESHVESLPAPKVDPPLVSMPHPLATCAADGQTLCLLNNRFQVKASYTDYSYNSGTGQAVSITSDTGYFWFFGASNVEAVVKMVPFCTGGSSNIGVYAGGLTDLGVTLTVTDTRTGLVKTYSNALGHPFDLIRDGPFTCDGSGGGGGAGQEITVTLPGGVPLVMVRIPAGTFQMGSPTSERNRIGNETLHQVTLTSDYYMGKYLVTQGQWKALMGSNPTSFSACGDSCPVERVSYDDIRRTGGFIERLNTHLSATGQEGLWKFHLPTEAEWERAARGGTQTRFSFGDALSGDDRCGANAEADPYVWWCANAVGTTHPVGTKKVNPYGLFDMHGNLLEWCQDWYDAYPSSPQTNPTGPSSGTMRVLRGGDWYDLLLGGRSAKRFYSAPVEILQFNGFRLARSL